MRSRYLPLIAVFLLPTSIARAGFDATIRIEPPAVVAAVGEEFNISVIADINVNVVGWGLDLLVDAPGLFAQAPPSIGPLWFPAPSLDGDGLAGLAFPNSVSGEGVLLGTITFKGLAPGTASLVASYTEGDATEGLAIDPTGFATIEFQPASVTIVPEPAAGSLLALGLGFLSRPKRRRSFDREPQKQSHSHVP